MPKWVAGKSGNPAGRPKRGQAIAELSRNQVTKHAVLEKLGKLASRVNDKGLDASTQSAAMAAAKLLVEYGWGKPKEAITRPLSRWPHVGDRRDSE